MNPQTAKMQTRNDRTKTVRRDPVLLRRETAVLTTTMITGQGTHPRIPVSVCRAETPVTGKT